MDLLLGGGTYDGPISKIDNSNSENWVSALFMKPYPTSTVLTLLILCTRGSVFWWLSAWSDARFMLAKVNELQDPESKRI